MTSPGGAVVGRVSVRVLPDTSGFRAKLEAELRRINPEVKVRIVPDLDTTRLRAQLQALNLRDINMRVDVDGVALAIAELTQLELIVDRLDGRNIRLRIDVDGLAEALAQIASLEAALAALRASVGSLNVGGGGGGGLFGGGVLSIPLILAAISAVSFLLVYAGAAITAAWGAVSTAIAAVPAALTLVALPIAAIAIGIDGITKAAKTLKPEMDALGKTISGVFQTGFTKAFNTIRPLFSSVLTPGFTNIANSINLVVNALAKMAATKDVQTLLTNMFNGVSNSIALIRPGILDIVDSILLLAGRSSMFDALTNTVNRFGQAWRTQLVDNINSGALDGAFRGLQDVLLAATEGLTSFVHNGIEVFAAAAPSVAAVVDSLTGFFNRFDWTALGAAVGGVFDGLAGAIRNVPQATIDGISAAFVRMGDAFKDPAFQASLTGIANQLPGIIDGITTFGKDFAGIAEGIASAITLIVNAKKKLDELGTATQEFGKTLGLDKVPGTGTFGPEKTWAELDDEIDRWLGIIPPKAEQLGRETGSGLANGISNTSPAALRAIENATQPIPNTVQQNLGQVPQIAQSALAPLPPTAQAIFLQLQPVMQGALAGLATTAQLGFASVAAAVATGGPAMIAAITTAFVGTDVAVTTAFGLMALKAKEGLNLVAAAIGEGFTATILPAFDAAFVGVGEKFIVLGQQMAAKMTEGLEAVRQAAISGSLLIDDVFLRSQQAWISFVQVGTGLMVTYMQTGMQQLLDTVNVYLVAIANLFLIWGFNMNTLMIDAMNGINAALVTGFAQAQATVDSSVAAMVASLQGAIPQFREAGSNMGAALAEGLRSRQGEVEAAAAALANAAAAAVRAAAVIRSPSKVFDHLGQMVGKGFAGGMSRTIGLIRSVSVGMVQAVNGSFSKLIDSSGAITDMLKDVHPTVQSQTSVYATGASLNVDDRSFGDIKESVADALSGWTVEIDQQGIAKLVNKQNLRNARR